MKIKSNKKIQVTSTVLGLVLLGAFVANQQSLSRVEDEVKPGMREPASVHSNTVSLSRQTVDENKLALQVAQPHGRGIASIGAQANDLESLRFGILQGKYDFKMNGDTITEIALPKDHEKPSVVEDRKEFLKNYASQFGAVGAPEKLSSTFKDDNLIEKYQLKTTSDKDKIVEITIGESNTLLNVKIGDAPNPRKLF